MMTPKAARKRAERAAYTLAVENPPTPEDRAVFDAGVKLRSTKGIYRDNYTPQELEFLRRVRKLAVEHGQRAIYRFCQTRKRERAELILRIPQAAFYHACPLCGTFHREGPKTFELRELARAAQRLKDEKFRFRRKHNSKQASLNALSRWRKEKGR